MESRLKQITLEAAVTKPMRYSFTCMVCGVRGRAMTDRRQYCSDRCRKRADEKAIQRRIAARREYIKPKSENPEIDRVARLQRAQIAEQNRRRLKAEIENYPNPFREAG